MVEQLTEAWIGGGGYIFPLYRQPIYQLICVQLFNWTESRDSRQVGLELGLGCMTWVDLGLKGSRQVFEF
jgi:hypothetical protein